MKRDVIIGRFNPPHLGHVRVLETMKNPIVVIVYTAKDEVMKNPLYIQERMDIMREICKNIPNAQLMPSKTGFLNDILTEIHSNRGNYRKLYAGEDRYYGYMKNIQKYDLPKPVQLVKVDRFTSSTYIRECAKYGNKSMFEALTPEPVHKFYNLLNRRLSQFRFDHIANFINLSKKLTHMQRFKFEGEDYSNLKTSTNRIIAKCRKFVQGSKDQKRVTKILHFFISEIKCYNLYQEYVKILLKCNSNSVLARKMIGHFAELCAQRQTNTNKEV